ncbi:MAG: type I methionyl aminopeptidase [Myxococcales bacterium FL481]|nr:MAG: type I methionyl aminopeptidase [Myxococcales bacterium FL481]
MAVTILSAAEVERMRAAGRVAAGTLSRVCERVAAGVSTAQIDAWVREDTVRQGARPSQLGYKGFPAAVCTSRNAVVCHGIPSSDEVVADGDIINIDVTSEYRGFHGDTSRTVSVGTPSADARHVTDVSRRCLAAGIEVVRPGVRLGDVGAAIEALARSEGCGVVTEFAGHGIGRNMHQPPMVMHVGPPGKGLRLRPGMAFTIEPMITIGWPKLVRLDDGWTVLTADGSPTAQFEHTVVVTDTGCEITTDLMAADGSGAASGDAAGRGPNGGRDRVRSAR